MYSSVGYCWGTAASAQPLILLAAARIACLQLPILAQKKLLASKPATAGRVRTYLRTDSAIQLRAGAVEPNRRAQELQKTRIASSQSVETLPQGLGSMAVGMNSDTLSDILDILSDWLSLHLLHIVHLRENNLRFFPSQEL